MGRCEGVLTLGPITVSRSPEFDSEEEARGAENEMKAEMRQSLRGFGMSDAAVEKTMLRARFEVHSREGRLAR